MKKLIMLIALALFFGCTHVEKKELSNVMFFVNCEKKEGTHLILDVGTEEYYVYGGEIELLFKLQIFKDGSYIINCITKNKTYCESIANIIEKAKKDGGVTIKYTSQISTGNDRTGAKCTNLGGIIECVKKTSRPFSPTTLPLNAAISFLETYDPTYGYRLINIDVGEKYLKAKQSKEMKKNELWDAIIWNPEDIVKEKDATGEYIYKDSVANKGYNYWRRKD